MNNAKGWADRFCRVPFERLEILADGGVVACCGIGKRLGNVLQKPVDAIWNGAVALDIRRSILDGSFRYCDARRCPATQARLPRRDAVAEPALRDILAEGRVVMAGAPREIVLSEDASCNLACPACRSVADIADAGRRERLGAIAQAIMPLLDAREPVRIAIAGDGEPWASDHYQAILRHLAETDCGPHRLAIQTNGIRMSEARWTPLAALERHRPDVSVSVDAATAFTYSRLRPPGPWRQLHENLSFIARLRSEGGIGQFEISMTVQADNYAEMVPFISLGRSLGCDGVSFRRIQPRPHRRAADFAKADVADPAHPEHDAFLWELRNSVFADPFCRLSDLDGLRGQAMAMTVVPDDRLAFLADFRARHGESAHVRNVEGIGLMALDQPWRAVQRFLRALELEPSPRHQLHVGLAMLRARLPVQAIPYLKAGLEAELSCADYARVASHLAKAKRALKADAAD